MRPAGSRLLELLEEHTRQLALANLGGGEKYIERHRGRGKLLARERVELLLDPDSPFLELSPLAGWGTPYTVGASIVTGIGVVEGTEVMVVANDPTVRGGAVNPFMPKPLFGENGSGMHTHQSLFADGKNAFYDPDDQYFLSDVGKAFIAGQLKHAREICSIFAQWVNSYKRLVPGYEAPVYAAWSRRNRSALVRVPLYHPGKEQATRMELRCPDPACNPYLTFAVLLQAGLEGIEKGYELPDPMEKNLYHLTAEERRRLGIEQLPESLGEAIEITAESELMLRTLGEHTFNRYIEIKRQEWEDYRVQVTQWELDRYLAIL